MKTAEINENFIKHLTYAAELYKKKKIQHNELKQHIESAIEWKEEYATQSKVVDIDFCGNVLARIEFSANNIKVTNAMNGGGHAIDCDKIRIMDATPPTPTE